MLQTIRKNWRTHLFLFFCVAIAALMLCLTPIWALEWYRTPFPGFLLGPYNVVSQSSAQRRQVYIQKATYEIVKVFVIAEALEPLMVKGREQPVEVYLLKGMK
jgi:hypothetical protein